ncbi:MAG: DUF3971 domain-containing protein, partial [Pseudomonadota bacterium]
ALLGGGASVTTITMNYAGRIGDVAAELGLTFEDMPSRDIAGQSPALAWLSALEAPISGAFRAVVDETGALGPLNATLQIGKGALHPEDGARPIPFDSAHTYFTYNPDLQKVDFTEIFVDSKWIRAQAAGQAFLIGAEEGWPSESWSQFEFSEVTTSLGGLYPDPITLDRARMEFRLRLNPFVVTLGEVSLFDLGEVMRLSGEARADALGWRVSLDGEMDEIAPDRLMEVWPTAFAPKAREWIVANVLEAGLRNIQFAFRGAPEQDPGVFLGFDFENFTTRFMRDVPPIENAHGHATLNGNHFVVAAKGGHITAEEGGKIDITGTSFEIPDTRPPRTPAQVGLAASAPITAALSLLDEPPFGFVSRAGLPVTLAEGRAVVAGVLSFRMVDKLDVGDVTFDLAGELQNVESDRLAQGHVLSAETLDLAARHTGMSLEGQGRIGDVPFEGRYEMAFGPAEETAGAMGQVRGDIEFSERFLEEFRVGLPPGSLSGVGRAAVEIDLARESPASLRLQSDLDGVEIRFDALDWNKPASRAGQLNVIGKLGTPPVIDRIELDADGLRARGAVSLRPDGTLDRAAFTQLTVGDWLEAPVELVGRGEDAPPLVRVLGGRLDLRQTAFLDTSNGGSGDGGPLSIALDRLTISDKLALTAFRAELDTTRGAAGPFSGLLNGISPITGQMIPQNGGSALRIRSEDAGGFFAATGLIKQARNGTVDLSLVPGQGTGVWEGQLTARDGMRLKDAPTMAALLNAVSVVGLLEQMGGEGIHFEAVDARFQVSPQRITLYSSSAIGASMGISMDGYYYPDTGRMDMQGVVSPFYLVNAVGGILTRRGEGLIGFSYSIRGPSGAPTVSVNPLSALTPGMFRDLFRRQPPRQSVSGATQGSVPDDTADDGSVSQTAPETGGTSRNERDREGR